MNEGPGVRRPCARLNHAGDPVLPSPAVENSPGNVEAVYPNEADSNNPDALAAWTR
jgi:hypothetical protein